MNIPNECRLAAAEAYSKASAGGATFEQAFWKALESVEPLIAAQAWEEGEKAGYSNCVSVENGLSQATNPYRSQA